mmetsp:Transcript_5828/g.7326  ORF Transcript_5828/g.7326 Transcript_5828/m.7326 type:complete len:326 (-) Transcript_5828:25-1002(-)
MLQPDEKGLAQWLKIRHVKRENSEEIKETLQSITRHAVDSKNFWSVDDWSHHIFPRSLKKEVRKTSPSTLEKLIEDGDCGEITSFLQQDGISPTIVNEFYLLAIQSGNTEIIGAFLSYDEGLLEWRMGKGQQNSALHIAAHRGHLWTVELLLEKGHDPNARNALQETPLHLASRSAPHYRKAGCVRVLVEAGADLQAACNQGLTALHHAMRSKDERTLLILLKAGADIYSKDISQRTPYEYGIVEDSVNNFDTCVFLSNLIVHIHGQEKMNRIHCFIASKMLWKSVFDHFYRICPVCKRSSKKCLHSKKYNFGHWLLTHNKVPKG